MTTLRNPEPGEDGCPGRLEVQTIPPVEVRVFQLVSYKKEKSTLECKYDSPFPGGDYFITCFKD